jgi:uncharacterized protein
MRLVRLSALCLFVVFPVFAQQMPADACAFEKLEKLSKQADMNARVTLAGCLLFNSTRTDDRDRGFALMKSAADAGIPVAMFNIGSFYLHGIGVQKDPEQAMRWLSAADEGGFPMAKFSLGNAYLRGQGIPKDTDRGIALLKQAAANGVATAASTLALVYSNGRDVPKDLDQARYFAVQARDAGFPMSQEILAQIEKELDPNNPHVVELELRRGAEAGEPGAQFTLGTKLVDEQDQTQQKEGVQWLRKSAAQFYLPAAVKLSELYADGKAVNADKEKSRRWLQVAAEGGFPEGQVKLAMKLLESKILADQQNGIKWLVIAGKLDSQAAALELTRAQVGVSPELIKNGTQAAADWLTAHPNALHMKDGEYLYSAVIKVDSPLPD